MIKTKPKNKKNFMIWNMILFLIFILFSFVSILKCINSNYLPYCYKNLFYLPLSCALVNILFLLVIKHENILLDIPTWLILTLIFLRNSVTVYFMALNGGISSLGFPLKENADISIIMIIYETCAVYFFIFYYKKVRHRKLLKKSIHINFGKYSIFKPVFWISFLICAVAFLLLPEIRTQYYTIFTKDITHIVQEEANYNSGSALRVLYTVSDILIDAMRLLVPSYFMIKIKERRNLKLNIVLVIALIFLQCLFMNDSNAFILIIMLAQILFAINLFPELKKIFINMGITVLVAFLIVLYFNRFVSDHYAGNLGLILQSYIPSVANTAGIFSVEPSHNFMQIFDDIFTCIPFKSFFGYTGGIFSISDIWNNFNNISGQIISTVAQSYYYFGIIFTPLLTCLMIWTAYISLEHVKSTNNLLLLSVFIYFTINFSISPFVYNGIIYCKSFLQMGIFMFLIAGLYNDKKI